MTLLTAEQAHERAAAGAAWLDEHCPTWFNEIDLDTLDLASGRLCVLGQTAPCLVPEDQDPEDDGYTRVSNYYRYQVVEQTPFEASRLGFDTPFSRETTFELRNRENRENYAMLQIAWEELIRARRLQEATA